MLSTRGASALRAASHRQRFSGPMIHLPRKRGAPAYISWDQFMANQARPRANQNSYKLAIPVRRGRYTQNL